MFIDRFEKALELAKAPTLERIRADAARMPHRLAKLLTYVADNLCDPALNATSAQRAVGIRDHSLPTVFRAHTGTTLRPFIENARLEIADRLLRGTDFEAGDVGMGVGYEVYETFVRAYRRWCGEKPSEARCEPSGLAIDYATYRRAARGKLDPEEARDFQAQLRRLYPEAEAAENESAEAGVARSEALLRRLELARLGAQEARGFLAKFLEVYPEAGQVATEAPAAGEAPPRVVIDGGFFERFSAEQVWQEIRGLPAEEQRRHVRRYEFRSPALFDLLRRRSREEGRKDRRIGVQVAELAMVSLEGGEEVFGGRVHDLRALGWAWLGNVRRLALDFPAAEEAFEQAGTEWRRSRARRDQRVLARMSDLEASLRICQRRYDEALRLVERARTLFRQEKDRVGEARVLIQRAAIHVYQGSSEAAIGMLEEAASLIKDHDEPYLSFGVRTNLAHAQVEAGQALGAAETLDRARVLCARLDHPLAWLEIRWVAGYIQAARGDSRGARDSFVAARIGFAEAGERYFAGLLGLELAILGARQSDWAEVTSAAAEAASILGSLNLYPETLAAVSLLSQALQAGEVSAALLHKVRERALRDPLARLQ